MTSTVTSSPAAVLVGMLVWLFGASAWNLWLGLAGPIILLVAFGTVGVSLIRMDNRDWSPAA
ncbi:hypothetical protein [Microtetraspora sp. NBRC 16547]|uniref:hypothetical protein n=1 Tax=Microtetraspora sp. NBRC 16547 TaxID=3030993 RepID=UPI0024A3A96A|nr:hypothetical protein [Microtetraspora sp. NBRC 16547]GLW98741.1 hypothetical protein Misp02_28280 [Microtetraspora sp. NBRC 16547]